MDAIENIIDDLRQGRMVIIVDDEDRENEGDLLIAATRVKEQDINFMAMHGRGLICLTLTRERCGQLKLPLMVSSNHSRYSTNFTVSIDAAKNITKGISAADRATTIQAAVAPNAESTDLVLPGHIFPLMAQDGGVLTRAGHTEAGCDLARLAGLEPAAVIVEVLNEDGTMARRSDLEKFACEHDLRIGSIADLIEFRIRNEQTVKRGSEGILNTEFGEFDLIIYDDTINHVQHFALVRGMMNEATATIVRVHISDPVKDLTGATGEKHEWSLRAALQYVANEGHGVIVVLHNELNSSEYINKPCKHNNFKIGNTINLNNRDDIRTIGLGAQIIKDLGIRKMRVLGKPKKMPALSGFGLEIMEYIENSDKYPQTYYNLIQDNVLF